MKNFLQITVDVSANDLEKIAREQLGLVPAGEPKRQSIDISGPAFHPRSEAISAAIGHVIRATEKYDRDQYSNGEASAANALFEAGKRLKKAFAEEKQAKSMKGVFNV